MAKFRHERIEHLIMGVVADLILRGEIRDPRVTSMVSITGVKLAKDLTQATIMVSGFVADDQLSSAVAGLNHAAGFIQGHVARQVKLRVTPHLAFREDRSIREGFEVIQQMKDLDP
ncbi:MAG TPA: 30S ribosome-binding factor RbfA [Spirochaetia bacterium]|nr:30S ribosome-binding factor RbfA [Spirochaetia bacterium]